jgi:hypothetical protein
MVTKQKLPYTFQDHQSRIGQYAVTKLGRVLMKSEALLLESTGHKVYWKDKPGWQDGKLLSLDTYMEWLEKQTF